MQILSVGNSKTSFGHTRKEKMAEAYEFANMDDNQVRELAYKLSYDEKEAKKNQRKVMARFNAIPLVDTIAGGLLAGGFLKGSTALSTRAKAAGKRAAGWAGIIALVGAYSGVKKGLNASSEKMERFDKNHPVASFMLDLGLIFATTGALLAGGKKVLNKFPNAVSEFKQKVASVAKKIDTSKFSREKLPIIEEKLAGFAEKHPKLAKAGEKMLEQNVWIGLGLGFLAAIGLAGKENSKVNNTYKELKEAQLETAKKLTNVLGAQRDALAQNQVILKKELALHTEHHDHHPEPEPEPKPKKPID